MLKNLYFLPFSTHKEHTIKPLYTLSSISESTVPGDGPPIVIGFPQDRKTQNKVHLLMSNNYSFPFYLQRTPNQPIDTVSSIPESTVPGDGPPIVTGCPQDIAVNLAADSSSNTESVTWVEPTGVDTEGRVIIPAQTHIPGSPFGVGTTTVRYTFSDINGQTTPCRFDVVVTGECECYSNIK